uniref:Uncharacterized protein n=1 Tax=Candidatus Methanogaster sp. ANME-2c ERB4 TaxID=2759911 RepID=A0A7G9Y1H0_9EURY|nr:hypothetical protein OLEPNHLG_00001 [Methanosarcinales archaeon ANME-2c ERB4]
MQIRNHIGIGLALHLDGLDMEILADLSDRLELASGACGYSKNQWRLCVLEISLRDVDIRVFTDRTVRLVKCDMCNIRKIDSPCPEIVLDHLRC